MNRGDHEIASTVSFEFFFLKNQLAQSLAVGEHPVIPESHQL